MGKINKFIDLTCLKPNATAKEIDSFIDLADKTNPYSVCLYPHYLYRANKLKDSIKICTFF